MADMLGGGGAAGGLGNGVPLEQWWLEMPPVTRYWTTASVICSVLVQCHVISPFNMFYSVRAVFNKGQYWRLISTFIYFGPLSLDLVFHIFFTQRYSRLLEESSGRSPAKFMYLLTFASLCLLCLAPLFSIAFLGTALSSVLVYIWSRRNPDTQLSFLGLLVFKAPWLPWVLMAFSFAVHGTVPKDEICGVVVGHCWYYFNDIYPPTHGGSRPLDPPSWWIRLWEPQQADALLEAENTGAADVQGDLAAAAAAPVPAPQ
ncbi:uncharacterized protein PV09_07759 [Verruconis gallopava]|uniref:Derlin n=1 Tax=Verruconis gallopava TaxID=253628 RepID=A0A0D2ANR8_9PEZI|nr:uncharacterized protein PV09_07759 [Verruconis gallopava]KIW00779.1 hypothetical protein PV09_07759 [Verruconis gallopava]